METTKRTRTKTLKKDDVELNTDLNKKIIQKKDPKKTTTKKQVKKPLPKKTGKNVITVKRDDTAGKKKALLLALEKSLGIVSTACSKVGISREMHYRWCKEDKEYAEKADSIRELAIDLGESKLFENIEAGRETSIIFFLKTIGKKRGYIERQEVEKITNIPVSFDSSLNPDAKQDDDCDSSDEVGD